MRKHYFPKSNFGLITCCFMLILFNLGIPPNTFGFSSCKQSKKITYSAKNTRLSDFFEIINKQTGIVVRNNQLETELNETKWISVHFNQAEIQEVMNFILNDRKELAFHISGNLVTIYNRYKSTLVHTNANDTVSNQQPVIGRITDKDGTPIPGATVKIKYGKYGTISNSAGVFQLTHAKLGDVLTISSIGFESTDIEIRNINMTITLKSYTNTLDENVIIAYGKTTRRFNTGNIGSVKASEIEMQPVNNPILALEGRVAGVFIEQASGFPGTGVKVAIQGQNSLFKGNDPFYVIDDVPYISQLMQPTAAGITAGASGITGNPLNFINPSDIESIEVLKDADATAIYGSRAANGAILITTKRGKSGSMRTNLDMRKGFGQVGHRLKVLNTQQYLQMRHEAFKNDGKTTPSPGDYDLNGTWDTTTSRDWQKELIGGTAQNTDIQLGISGGTDQIQYLVNGAYHKETSVFPGDFSDVKGSTHFNIRSASLNQKFRLVLSGSYLKDKNLLPSADLTGVALKLAPVAPNPLNSDGSLNWAPTISGASSFILNPLTYLKQKYSNKTDNLISQANITYDILPWLTLKSGFGYNILRSNEILSTPLSSAPPEYRGTVESTSNFSNSNMNSWLIEPGIEMNKRVYEGKLNVYIGTTLQSNSGNRQSIEARGFSNDLLIEDIKSASLLRALESANFTYRYSALYGRINYNLMDKYILNLSARRDGSSRFGPQNQFHNFGAIGAAWIFSQTNTIQKLMPFISFGKIRASYGTTGNDQIGDYQFLNLYDIVLSDLSYQQGPLGLAPIKLNTPDLQWEETKKFQIGLELGFLKDRILVNSNYNLNRSSNQLLGVRLPNITGFSGITRNINAVVQNTGWEFSVNTTNIRTQNFSWTTNINLTIPKNELESYQNSTNVFLTTGQSITTVSVAKLAGVNDTTGKYQFIDDKGDLSSIPKDITKYVNVDPKFYGGFQNSINFKGFSIDILFQFVKRTGQDITYGYSGAPAGGFGLGMNNQPVTVLNRWQQEGDKASHAKFTSRGGDATSSVFSARASDASYSDASFIRLKNISLSWKVPERWIKKVNIKNIRLYALGQNILTITNYFGVDPESRGIGLPPLRLITFGAQITL